MARIQGSDDLYRLIHSLTREEKGYFKKFTGRHGTGVNKHIRLFDQIAAQKKFEERSLNKEFKRLDMMKIYLFQMILQSLLTYKKDWNVEFQLLKDYIYVDILRSRGLTAKAVKLLEQGLKIAEDAEIFWLKEMFLRQRYVLTFSTIKDHRQRIGETKNTFDKISEILALRADRDKYLRAIDMLKALEYEVHFTGDKNLTPDALVDIGFLKDENRMLSPGTERMRLHALAQYYDLKNQSEGHFQIFLKLYALEQSLLAKKSPVAKPTAANYALTGLINASLHTNRFAKAESLFPKLLSSGVIDKEWGFDKDNYYFWLQSRLYIDLNKGKHQEGLALLKEQINVVLEMNRKNDYDVYVSNLYQIKILFEFSTRLYQDCMVSINELETMAHKQSSPRIFKDCEIVKALVQLDLKNEQLVPGILSYFLKKDKTYQLSKPERKLFRLLVKINGINYNKTIAEAYRVVSASPRAIMLFSMFDIKYWFQSKLTVTEIAENLKADIKK